MGRENNMRGERENEGRHLLVIVDERRRHFLPMSTNDVDIGSRYAANFFTQELCQGEENVNDVLSSPYLPPSP